MPIGEIIRLVQIVAWPVVIVLLAIIYRREIPRLFQSLGGKVSKLTAVGITLEFTSARAAAGALHARLDQIREPTSTGPPPPSGSQPLIELTKSSPAADYLVIDLRDGNAWLTSRLYLFAVVLPQVMPLRCFVFIGDRPPVPQYFIGIAPPECVVRRLEAEYPWLRKAKVESLLQPVVSRASPNHDVSWWPPEEVKPYLRQLTQGPAVDVLDVPRAEALDNIARALINPIDLSQPGQVEVRVNAFLQSPSLRRPHDPQATADWVHLKTADEHAQWIRDERQLLDLLQIDLSREHLVVDAHVDNEAILKAVLRKRGNFVALIDAEGRFERLIDRAGLLEKVAAAGYS